MVQPQSVPAKKGMSVWAWLAIGCVGILVVCGIAVGGFVWWGAHKVKAMAADMQAHPDVAAVKMIVAMNPDLEMVSTDEANGKVTIHNKKTNETVTLDMADVKNGNISFTGADGKQGSMTFDQSAGKVEVKGADGSTASFGGGAATKLPDWVPAYPGGTAEGVYSGEDANQATGSFGLTTSDSVTQVFSFYKQELSNAGFKVNESHYSANGSDGGMVTGESADGKRTVTFTVATDSGKTRVAGVYSEKKQ
jgi:hypothetical protein